MPLQKKITVTFFLPSLQVGGTEKNVVNLINNIDRGQYDVSLALGKKQGELLSQIQKDVLVVDMNASYSLGLFFALITYFRTQKPDIFVSSFPRINIICLAAKIVSGAKTKIIITEHSVFSLLPIIAKTPWRRMIARFMVPGLANILYPGADAMICVSQGIADDITKTLNIKHQKMNIIYNPVVDSKVLDLSEEAVSHPWFSNKKIPIILAVGRLVPCKDYPTLFKAFESVIKNQSCRLVILGVGPEKEKLINLVDAMNLSSHIIFLGFQKNPYKYMKRASVFVLSSLQEGFGNVIIEAMFCGLPVVSTDCPIGPAEIITAGQNGLLVPMRDWESLATAIVSILKDPILAKKISDGGKRRSEFFSVKKSVQEYQEVFQRVNG